MSVSSSTSAVLEEEAQNNEQKQQQQYTNNNTTLPPSIMWLRVLRKFHIYLLLFVLTCTVVWMGVNFMYNRSTSSIVKRVNSAKASASGTMHNLDGKIQGKIVLQEDAEEQQQSVSTSLIGSIYGYFVNKKTVAAIQVSHIVLSALVLVYLQYREATSNITDIMSKYWE